MNRPTLRQLEYAVALADHGNFGRAADAVHVTQPGLSSQIRELEHRVGVPLFERTSRQVRLTPAGADVVARARAVLREVDELSRAAGLHQGTLRGQLRLAAIPTMAPYLLPALLPTLRARWPDVRVELQELQTAAMVDALDRGDLDLGLLAVPYDTRALHVEPVAHEPFLLALPTDHELVGTDPVPVSVLAGLPVLLLEEGHCLHDHALQACRVAGDVDHGDVRNVSLATLSQMVAGGGGVTLLPASAVAVETRPGSGVTARPFAPPRPGRTIALAWRGTDPRSSLFAATAAALHGPIEAALGRTG